MAGRSASRAVLSRRNDLPSRLTRAQRLVGIQFGRGLHGLARWLRKSPVGPPLQTMFRITGLRGMWHAGARILCGSIGLMQRHPRLSAVCLGCAVVGIAAVAMQRDKTAGDDENRSKLKLVFDQVQVFPPEKPKVKSGTQKTESGKPASHGPRPSIGPQRPAWLTGVIEAIPERGSGIRTISHEQWSPGPAVVSPAGRYRRSDR